MLMMAPLFCWRMIGITCLAARMQLLRLIATQRSNASSVILSSSASPPDSETPTLLCRTSMRPHRPIASATIFLMSASLVTSALKAAAVPWLLAIRSAVSCADSSRLSTHSTLAPSRPTVGAVARPFPMPSPGLWPAPTTIATLSFKRMSRHSRARQLLRPLVIGGLVVDPHGRKHAHSGTVEGYGEQQGGHVLVREALLELGEGRLRHADVARQLARALEDRLGQRLELGGLALGLREQAFYVLVGDAEL